MPLNLSPKINPNNPTSQPAARPQINVNPQSPSTARAESLKQRLQAGPPKSQAVAPRPAGSSARAAEFANLKKWPTPPPAAGAAPAPAPAAPAAPHRQPLMNVPPQPSGLNPDFAGQPAPAPAAAAPAAPATGASGADATTNATAASTQSAEATSPETRQQFDAIARRERSIRKAQQDLKTAQDTFQQDREKYVPREEIASQYVSRNELQTNPLKVLAAAGITYDRLVDLQLAQVNADAQSPTPNSQHDQQQLSPLESQLLNEVKSLKEQLTKVDNKFEERDNLQKQQALKQIRMDAELLVDSDPASFETIRATESVDLVVDLIEKVFDAEGIVLSVEDAAKQLEGKLLEQEYARFQKLQGLTKIKSKLAPQPQEQSATVAKPGEASLPEVTVPAEAAATEPPPQFTTKTLTNTGAVQRPLSARERAIAAAMRARSGG